MPGLYYIFDVASDTDDDLKAAIALALNSWMSTVTHVMDKDNALLFLSGHVEGASSLIIPYDAFAVYTLAQPWLAKHADYTKAEGARGIDGSECNGWRIRAGESLGGSWCTLKIEPYIIGYHK